MDEKGLIYYPERGGKPAFRRFLDDDGTPVQSIWSDISPVNSQAIDRLGYPTQKPVELLDRIIRASCPEHGIVLDCFAGSGTTMEAAERLGIDTQRRAETLDVSEWVSLARELSA